MLSAGHVMDMIRRIKANRELTKAKHARHAKIKTIYGSQVHGITSPSPTDQFRDEEFSRIGKKIIGKIRLQQR